MFTVNEAAALFRMSRQKFLFEVVEKRGLPFQEISGKKMFCYQDIEEFHHNNRKQLNHPLLKNLQKISWRI